MLQRIITYHSKAIGYYMNHYDFFSLASEAANQAAHMYHILHIVL
jgi:hypothetical protein